MNKYLKIKKYLVRNDKESILIFFRYFIDKPPFLLNRFLSRAFYSCFERFLAFCYLPIMGRLLFNERGLEEGFIIRRLGGGEELSRVELFKKGKGFVVRKIFSKKDDLKREMAFINEYKNCSKLIKLPKCQEIDDQTIEFEFIEKQNFEIDLKLGYINKRKALNLYKDISVELKAIYNKKPALIHGDLTPCNMYLKDNKIYIIDFSDSHFYDSNFDSYVLLREICFIFSDKKRDILKQNFSNKEINSFERHLLEVRNKKHGNPKK